MPNKDIESVGSGETGSHINVRLASREKEKTGIACRAKVENMFLCTEKPEDRPAISQLMARAFADQANGEFPAK